MKQYISKVLTIWIAVIACAAAFAFLTKCTTFDVGTKPVTPPEVVQTTYTALAVLQDTYVSSGGSIKALHAAGEVDEKNYVRVKIVGESVRDAGLIGKDALLSYWDNPDADALAHLNAVRTRAIAAATKLGVTIALAEEVPGPVSREMIEALYFPPWSEL